MADLSFSRSTNLHLRLEYPKRSDPMIKASRCGDLNTFRVRRREFLSLALISLIFLGVVGCDSHPETAPASGKVSFNGEPLKFGSVMFQPVDGGQPARAEIKPDGSFEMSTYAEGDGAPLGKHRVRIMCSTAQDPSNPIEISANDVNPGKLLIPRKYTQLSSSGLIATVAANENPPFVFDLKGPNR